jgi:hypothetical protein
MRPFSPEPGLLVKHITKSLTLSLPYRAHFMTNLGAAGAARHYAYPPESSL